tara:strand:- start:78 stop:515 length:438 start_codon:yes stop_codon:yes gene_type:complete
MSLQLLANSISEQFSGKEFTGDELIQFLLRDCAQSPIVEKETKKGKKEKKEKKEKKKIKMTVRKYFMKDESYKAQISERVKENKAFNKDNASEISSGEEESRPENFMQVLKVIMEDLSGDELQEIQDKVDEWNQENGFGDSEDEA